MERERWEKLKTRTINWTRLGSNRNSVGHYFSPFSQQAYFSPKPETLKALDYDISGCGSGPKAAKTKTVSTRFSWSPMAEYQIAMPPHRKHTLLGSLDPTAKLLSDCLFLAAVL